MCPNVDPTGGIWTVKAPSDWTAGKSITIALSGPSFIGFLMTATLGTFDVPAGGQFQLLNCDTMRAAALTHNSPDPKAGDVNVVWRAPLSVGSSTSVTFTIVVLSRRTPNCIYQGDELSIPIATTRAPTPLPPTPPTTTLNALASSCFLNPSGSFMFKTSTKFPQGATITWTHDCIAATTQIALSMPTSGW